MEYCALTNKDKQASYISVLYLVTQIRVQNILLSMWLFCEDTSIRMCIHDLSKLGQYLEWC